MSDFSCQHLGRFRGKGCGVCVQPDTDLRSPGIPIWEQLIAGIHDQERVSGFTHSFYKYPARFSPLFARQVIAAFSKPGDLVLDPFMGAGGGTTLVEARALGRRAIGSDINSLAVFLAETKTAVFRLAELRRVRSWVHNLIPQLNLRRRVVRATDWADLRISNAMSAVGAHGPFARCLSWRCPTFSNLRANANRSSLVAYSCAPPNGLWIVARIFLPQRKSEASFYASLRK